MQAARQAWRLTQHVQHMQRGPKSNFGGLVSLIAPNSSAKGHRSCSDAAAPGARKCTMARAAQPGPHGPACGHRHPGRAAPRGTAPRGTAANGTVPTGRRRQPRGDVRPPRRRLRGPAHPGPAHPSPVRRCRWALPWWYVVCFTFGMVGGMALPYFEALAAVAQGVVALEGQVDALESGPRRGTKAQASGSRPRPRQISQLRQVPLWVRQAQRVLSTHNASHTCQAPP